MQTNSLFDDGIKLFNDGEYFEAHEVWEELWRATDQPIRGFYQGLIHAAVGLHHLRRRNQAGARQQLSKSIRKLGSYPPDCCGIDNAGLTTQLGAVLRTMTQETIRIVRTPALP
jgi:predicted metal-dependent hydrolase